MAEQLQELLDRIQRDGVDKAEAEAGRIVEAARKTAADMVANAEAKAEALHKQAERDSKTFVERGHKALEQAARDVLLSLGEAINRTVQTLVRQDVAVALTPDALAGILADVVRAYTAAGDVARDVTILVSEGQQADLLNHVKAKLGAAATKGLQVLGDGRVTGGFRVVLKDDNVEHDFTQDAISDSLCKLLRPHIASIVHEASKAS
ncbi:MAG: hypothetical protein O3C57_03795 [Verrucomicrobia bacterium]|nr:hypothetical protein [Verrucomicrobiota bacterium]